jgi:hypothetical protein
MTLLAANDTRVICRTQLTGEGRWVSVALSLADLASANRFLVSAERLLYEMAGADKSARKYGFLNWQGGAISGARYAFRALNVPIQEVCLHELRGRLGSGDVWAVSAVAALAVARLLGRPEVPLDLGGWKLEEEVHRPQATAGVSQSAKGVASQPESPQERTENGPPLQEMRVPIRPHKPFGPNQVSQHQDVPPDRAGGFSRRLVPCSRPGK